MSIEGLDSRSDRRQILIGEYCVVLERSAADEDEQRWRFVIYRHRPNLHYTNIIAGSAFAHRDANMAYQVAQERIAELDNSKMSIADAELEANLKNGSMKPYFGSNPIADVASSTMSFEQPFQYRTEDRFKIETLETSSPHSRMVEELAQAQSQGIAPKQMHQAHLDVPEAPKMYLRPSWDEFYMGLAEYYATMSTCNSKVGAILVDNETQEILGAGFNGAPYGMDHCIDVGCYEWIHHSKNTSMCIRCIHAEVNAIMQALKHGWDQGPYAMLYTTRQPCYECLKLIIQNGIANVWYRIPYEDDRITQEMRNRVAQRHMP